MTRVILGVRGMTTEDSALKVQRALMLLEGVKKVDAGTDQQASVEYDPTSTTTMDLIRALRRAGYTAGME